MKLLRTLQNIVFRKNTTAKPAAVLDLGAGYHKRIIQTSLLNLLNGILIEGKAFRKETRRLKIVFREDISRDCDSFFEQLQIVEKHAKRTMALLEKAVEEDNIKNAA